MKNGVAIYFFFHFHRKGADAIFFFSCTVNNSERWDSCVWQVPASLKISARNKQTKNMRG
jgi:hypothetical protein